jgi:daunorubicin resistance ABC transporter membrane protein
MATPVETRPLMERPLWREELDTLAVLVRRDLVRFFREKSRVVGALVQPMIFWLVIGSGMASTFVLPGARELGYQQYFYPGVVVMVALFSAIFTTMSVIEDRHSGFLQAVMVAPGSRASVVLGKVLGASSVALSQSALFVLLAPVAGFSYGAIDWPALVAALVLSCYGLCALGFAVAWWLDSTAGYHVVMSLILLPMWILSGAMFPAPASGVLATIEQLNPIAYAVSAVRGALHGGVAPNGTGVELGIVAELAILIVFGAASSALALVVCHRRR